MGLIDVEGDERDLVDPAIPGSFEKDVIGREK